MSDKPASQTGAQGPPAQQSANRDAMMNPGDQAPPGTAGTGENLCRECGGTGRREGGEPCPACGGSGKVIEGISAGA
jgi:RecJ-like exonuclease